MNHTTRTLLLTALLMLSATPAFAQTQSGPATGCLPTDPGCTQQPADDGPATRIDPKFRFLEQVLATEGRDSPVFGRDGAPSNVTDEGVGATLRFADEISEPTAATLEKQGVEFARRDGELVHVGAVYSAFVAWEALDFLADHPALVRAEVSWSPLVLEPLEVTSETVGAAQAHVLPEMEVDGSGVAIADIDSGFDVLHPHLFRADGGYFDWIDENENGLFDPGTDSVEVDGATVPLRVLDSTTIEGREMTNEDEVLQADSDWLYADVNGDGERNVGPENFDESTPAYGEPIFVVDDVDKNGELAPGEKLVRLKTSKFRRILAGSDIYVRGENLIDAADSPAAEQPGHGTGVSSILSGGQKGFHTRVGLAPGADIIGYAYGGQDSQGDQPGLAFDHQLSALDDAIDERATLVLHEWTNIVWVTHDGSSNMEYAMDQARDEGVIQVNPLGNLNQSDKHAHREVDAGQTVELDFHIGDGFQYGRDTYPYGAVYMSIFWSADHQPSITLVDPNGEAYEVPLDDQPRDAGEARIYGSLDVTDRGTRHAGLALWRDDRESLVQGDWTMRIEQFEQPDELTARVSDMYSSWGRGIYWTEPTADYGTMVFPSSAESAFGVAAFGGRQERPGDSGPGELRGYSGRGPTLDGRRGVDIAAPDDPFAALGVTSQWVDAGYGRSWFRTFGGTSGAGPHVAAAIALLQQQNRDWGPDELEQSIVDSAFDAGLVPEHGDYPNRHWGFGRLDVFGALYGTARPGEDNAAPLATLELNAEAGIYLDASGSNDPDGDALEYRFDYDYDGRWDTGWSAQSTAAVSPEFFEDFDTEDFSARVQVRDPSGARGGAFATGSLEGLPESEADAGSGADAGTDSGITVQQPSQRSDDSGCGCASGSGAPPVGGMLLALLVLAIGARPSRSCK